MGVTILIFAYPHILIQEIHSARVMVLICNRRKVANGAGCGIHPQEARSLQEKTPQFDGKISN